MLTLSGCQGVAMRLLGCSGWLLVCFWIKSEEPLFFYIMLSENVMSHCPLYKLMFMGFLQARLLAVHKSAAFRSNSAPFSARSLRYFRTQMDSFGRLAAFIHRMIFTVHLSYTFLSGLVCIRSG